ncbi:hypothetical protein PDL71_15465 [Lacibacter sp. MH-610]|uniref:hypothetical protein n=1 Tax=Lacibacter sp. MH-610 TaxID=3020883 RepID=UPI0038923C93
MPTKIQQYIDEQLQKSQEKLGTAAFKNVPQTGQIALEGQITTGDDVRVKESMQKSTYDANKDGTVDNAKEVDGNTPADLLDRANHTGTQLSGTISDFNSAVDSLLLWKYVTKGTSQVKNSDTTLANDTELVVPLSASNLYRVKFYVLLTTANAAMDYKFALNFSGTTTSFYAKVKYVPAGDVNENIVVQNSIISSTSVAAATSGVAYVEIDCIVDVLTSGSLGFQWAQDTSDAGNLTVLKGSYLEYAIMNPPL